MPIYQIVFKDGRWCLWDFSSVFGWQPLYNRLTVQEVIALLPAEHRG